MKAWTVEPWTNGYYLPPCTCGGVATIDELTQDPNHDNGGLYGYRVRCLGCAMSTAPRWVTPKGKAQDVAILMACEDWDELVGYTPGEEASG